MSRFYLVMISICLLAFAGGCRNCGGGCCLLNGFGNQTIAPPAAFGMTGQQPYYNTAQQPNYLINPNGQAPTPAGNNPSLAPQGGWRNAAETGNQSTENGSGNMSSVLAQNGQSQPNRLASLDPNAGFGSTQSSVNYQSTSVDERRDDSRLPVTDASGVRAPAAYYGGANNMGSYNNQAGFNQANYNRMAQA